MATEGIRTPIRKIPVEQVVNWLRKEATLCRLDGNPKDQMYTAAADYLAERTLKQEESPRD